MRELLTLRFLVLCVDFLYRNIRLLVLEAPVVYIDVLVMYATHIRQDLTKKPQKN